MDYITVKCPECGEEQYRVPTKSGRYYCTNIKCKIRFRFDVSRKDEARDFKYLLEKNKRLEERIQNINDFNEFVSQVITKEVKTLPSSYKPKIPKIKAKYNQEYAVLEFSDVQLGSIVEKRETGGLCVYNKQEFVKRIEKLTKSVFEIIEIQRNGGIPIKKLKLHVLGDIVQGEDVFPGQGFKIDTLLLEQVFVLGDKIVELLLYPLSTLFEDIEIFCIPGNHGKQGRQHQASRTSNWDYIVYWLWKQRMANLSHVKFHISAAPFLVYEMFPNNQLHALVHGNQARGWLGYPYYGIDRLYRKLSSLTGLFIAYLHHGHHHQPSLQDTHIGKKIGNGSIEGGSDYSVNELITANTPQQFLFGINPKGMTWEYWIRLAEYPKLTADNRGIYTTTLDFLE